MHCIMLYLCGVHPGGLVFLFEGLSSDPECRSADWGCSATEVSAATVFDRRSVEGQWSAWPPCCGRTQEQGRCNSYQLDRSERPLPAKQISIHISLIVFSWPLLKKCDRIDQDRFDCHPIVYLKCTYWATCTGGLSTHWNHCLIMTINHSYSLCLICFTFS